ncbi:MAG: rod shape-determining protein RodA [Actinomycetota bacterium]
MIGVRSGHRVEAIGRDRIVSERRSAKAPIRHFDLMLLLSVAGLSVIGALAVYATTRARQEQFGEDPALFLKRHIVYLAAAFFVFLGLLFFDYRQLRGFSLVLYGGVVLMLLIVLTPIGTQVAGAQRWIDLGVFQIQPAELAKMALIVMLAALYTQDRPEMTPDAKVLIGVGLTALLAVVIFVQPDLGTLMVLPAILFSVLLISGTRLRWLLALLMAGVVIFFLILNLGLIRDYQIDRLRAFMDPESDSQRAGYNLQQSLFAVGSGGLNGKGLFEGTQTNLDFVPEQHTDFVFTAIGEEGGFIGGLVVLGLFALLLWRALRIAMLSKDLFGTLLAAGIAGMLAFQVFVNVGMTIGLMPITGIPLPFLSYGGSSLIVNFSAVAVLMNIHMRRFV